MTARYMGIFRRVAGHPMGDHPLVGDRRLVADHGRAADGCLGGPPLPNSLRSGMGTFRGDMVMPAARGVVMNIEGVQGGGAGFVLGHEVRGFIGAIDRVPVKRPADER